MVGVNEVLKSGAVSRVTEGSRLEFETRIFERFLRELSTNEKATYGLNEVKGAIKSGAADIVLVTDRILRENRMSAGSLLKDAENMGASIAIISTAHDSGRQLQGLGGYAAILRYSID